METEDRGPDGYYYATTFGKGSMSGRTIALYPPRAAGEDYLRINFGASITGPVDGKSLTQGGLVKVRIEKAGVFSGDTEGPDVVRTLLSEAKVKVKIEGAGVFSGDIEDPDVVRTLLSEAKIFSNKVRVAQMERSRTEEGRGNKRG